MHGFSTTAADLGARAAALVDDYGHLAAQLAGLEARKEMLRSALVDLHTSVKAVTTVRCAARTNGGL